jgi:hypothetical protein
MSAHRNKLYEGINKPGYPNPMLLVLCKQMVSERCVVYVMRKVVSNKQLPVARCGGKLLSGFLVSSWRRRLDVPVPMDDVALLPGHFIDVYCGFVALI